MIKRCKTGLEMHVCIVAERAKKRQRIMEAYNSFKTVSDKIDDVFYTKIIQSHSVRSIVDKIKNNKVFKKACKLYGNKNVRRLIKMALMGTCFVVGQPELALTFALTNVDTTIGTDVVQTGQDIEKTMREIFYLLSIVGGWILIFFACKELVESIFKGERINVISVVLKYVLGFIGILILPTVFSWVRIKILKV